MKLFGEGRTPISEGYNLIPRTIPDIEEGIENMLQMPNFALWLITHETNLAVLQAIRDNQMGGNTSMVPNFRPYLSDPTEGIPGGFIITQDTVHYCPTAVGLHQNRDAYTMNHPNGNNFYTTYTIDYILKIVLKKRRLVLSDFLFASTDITEGQKEITLDDLERKG